MEPTHETVLPLSVLVIDGHQDAADSLAELLRLVGHTVTVARTGAAALRSVAADPPDVVLLEVRLPDLDGWQVAWQMHELGPDGKRPLVVAVTVCGSEADRCQSGEAGIDLYLVKPVEPQVLVEVLARFARMLALGAPVGSDP